MLYRMRRRITSVTRLLGMPLLGMMLAISVSATKAWAPADTTSANSSFTIVLN